MKVQRGIVLGLALLMVVLLAGCPVREIGRTLDAAEHAVDQKLDAVEQKVEDAVKDAVYPDPLPQEAAPKAETPAKIPEAQLSAEEAQAIALQHAELTAGEVSGLHVEFEIDDRVPHYDVEFHQGQTEYEYEIHGETGDILSYDRDL